MVVRKEKLEAPNRQSSTTETTDEGLVMFLSQPFCFLYTEKAGDVLRYTSQWIMGLPGGEGLAATAAFTGGGGSNRQRLRLSCIEKK